MTYTVYSDNDSSQFESGLSAVEAMDRLLTHDGYRYEIRPGDPKFGGFDLWHSDGSENSTRSAQHMVKTVAFSLNADEVAATEEIAAQVIAAGWPRLPSVMTDDDFAAMQRQAEAEDD